MKQFSILSLIVLSLFLFSFIGKSHNKTAANQIKQNSIEVYDFHTTNRCVTCKAIEANTKYTLDTYFQEEVKNGTIIFKVVNIDEEENYVLAEKFQASGTSLFFNVISSGKEKQIDLTGFAFSYGKDKEIFSNKLKRKLEKELENF